MRFERTLGVILVLSMAITASARAAEGELLGTEGVYETKDSGTATLESKGGGIAVKCTSSKGEDTALSTVYSTFDNEHFKNCTAGGFKCTGLLPGEAVGEITVAGQIEVLAFKEGTQLRLAAVYYFDNVGFKCLGVLIVLRGDLIGEITNAAGAKTTELKTSFVGNNGEEAHTSVNGVNHHLETSIGGGEYVETSLLQTVTGTGKEVEVMY